MKKPSREIKFRAWDKKKKCWCVGFVGYELLPGDASTAVHIAITDEGKIKGISNYDNVGAVDMSERVEVSQFTGLKDKNGKEIYEGDIVRGMMEFPQLLTGDTDENSNFKMAGIVFYDHSGFSLKCIQSMCDPDREGMVNYFDFIGGYDGDFMQMEIIGNIYENGDLLLERLTYEKEIKNKEGEGVGNRIQ